MTTTTRTIGVANGGGDCAGLNAVLRAVVKTAICEYGWRVLVVTNGFDALIWPELEEAVGVSKAVDPGGDHVRAARAIGITFGDGP